MIDEIKLLVENYGGRKWDKFTQKSFANDLSASEFFEGKLKKDDDFGARDRINRAPKSLGFVQLKPTIQLTDAGKQFVYGKRENEIFTRQLLKFQFPSPYHVDKNDDYFIRPYLELFRLIYELDGLTKDEIAIFFTECIHIDKYEMVKGKILEFRKKKKELDRKKTNYNRFFRKVFDEQLEIIYSKQISERNFKTRESGEKSFKKFLSTKRNNHMDYADAAIRYLRNTLLVTLQPRTYKVVIAEDKIKEVEFLLKNTKREPLIFNSEEDYQNYLFDASIPLLYPDNPDRIIEEIKSHVMDDDIDINIDELVYKDVEELKDIKEEIIRDKVDKSITDQVLNLQTYKEHDDVQSVYEDILTGDVVDKPLFLEWNTWRGFTMLNDGKIQGNFRVDDNGMPLSTAGGNMPDILCKYSNFDMLVEVTMSKGARQYETEGEPVARHVGMHKRSTDKETYCIFIAPSLNQATIAHFFALHKIDIEFYGGKSKIIPMTINDFRKMLEVAYLADEKPDSDTILRFLEKHSERALISTNEEIWYKGIKDSIPNWMVS